MESSSPLEDNRLGPSVCAPLGRQRINLTFLTHVAGDREVLCTASHNGEAALTLLRSQADPAASLALQPGTSILAVYPHDKRPEVIGTFIKSLARAREAGVAGEKTIIDPGIAPLGDEPLRDPLLDLEARRSPGRRGWRRRRAIGGRRRAGGRSLPAGGG